jgi:RNA polymerase sigma factor (sigma-70 family)
MTTKDPAHQFVASMAKQHDRLLRRFMSTRLRSAISDVPDLIQEVFLRLLRVPDPESIRTPEAYLFTVAKSVLHQHRAQSAAEPEVIDVMDVLAELEEDDNLGPEGQTDAEQRLAELQHSLEELPRKAYATLVLNRVMGLPLEQVGERLGISRSMAKKYLARALLHCRRHDLEIR